MYPKYQFYTEKNQKIFSPEGVKQDCLIKDHNKGSKDSSMINTH